MIFRMFALAYGVGLLFGSLALIDWLVARIARAWLAGSFNWLEVWILKMARRIAR
jgi:hypothetical protein